MRQRIRTALISAVALVACTSHGLAQDSRAAAIAERLDHANQWRDHVMVVAHRGGWKRDGRQHLPENSRAGVRDSIAIGVEIVELDVRLSADDQLVVMHDSWLDRTTTCKGEVDRRTLAELRGCRLIIEGTGIMTDEVVPTLAEMLEVARGQVLVNVDNKIGPEAIPRIAATVRAAGMQGQVIVKENIWSEARLAFVRAFVDQAGEGLRFMPIIADDAVADPRFVETVTRAFAPDAVEMVAWRGDLRETTEAAGPLFDGRVRAVAARGDWHLWVNTYPIVNKPSGFLARGRGDELAVAAGLPAEVYGYWAERGATIIQTDEPKAAIEWLAANGWRVPYPDAGPQETASTASIN